MLKKLIFVGGLTGAAHLITFWSLSYLSKKLDPEKISSIGEIDSLILLVVSVISFGLQLSASRNIATSSSWRDELISTQQARFSLSIILVTMGTVSYFLNEGYLLLLAAPFIALNADYALYSRGKPVSGALVAFIRVILPSFTLLFYTWKESDYLIEYYIFSLFLAYLLSGVLSANVLKVPYLVRPKLSAVSKYFTNISLGISSMVPFFIGIGVINIASYLYNDQSIAEVYLGLKLYVIFKGLRRIVVQTYFKEIQTEKGRHLVDFIAIFFGVGYVLVSGVYVEEFVNYAYGVSYRNTTGLFIVLSISGLVSSVFASADITLLFTKKDQQYNTSYISALIVLLISTLCFSIYLPNIAIGIGYSILFAEIAKGLFVSGFLGIKNFIIPRMTYILTGLSILAISFVSNVFVEEKLLSFTLSCTLLLSAGLVIYYRRFLTGSNTFS